MELWIRSQDKDSLIKVEKIKLIYDYLCSEDIQLIHIETDKGRIGSYSTKERAIEVLDEIQNILKPKYILDSSSIKPDGNNWVENGVIYQKYNANVRIEELSTYVYEMPEE